MKRAGATLETVSGEDVEESEKAADSRSKRGKQLENIKTPKILESTNIKKEDFKRKLRSGKTGDDVGGCQVSLQISKTVPEKPINKLNLKSLRKREKRNEEELKPSVPPSKNKLRAVVNLELMKEELKQLVDPPVSRQEKELSSSRLDYSFFDTACDQLAQNLLGKVLVRHLENGTILKGRIVETEGYLGAIDKASQSYQNRVTPRNIPMYMAPGTIYVYMTYGMYHCFNISSQGDGCAVLIRALEPLEGIEHMAELRSKMRKGKKPLAKSWNLHELCNGPSKLCMSYQLERCHSKYSMCSWKGLWLENHSLEEEIQVVKSTRIGIDSCGPEWAGKLLRYYVYGNKCVSKRDKKAEELMRLK